MWPIAPYDPCFQGTLAVVAYAMTSVGDQNRALSAITNVIYPAQQELQVGLRMARTMLRPGQTANADLHILTPDGHATESVLGVLVFHRAVAERVRTDEDFGGEYARPDPSRDAMRTSTKAGTFAYRPGRVAGKFTLISA